MQTLPHPLPVTSVPDRLIVGPSLPTLPWEDRPAGSSDVVWRYQRNPIIPHDLLPNSNSIFNSAVVPFKKGSAGVFRVDTKSRDMQLHAGKSQDAINWRLALQRIVFVPDNPVAAKINAWGYGYKPRVTWLEDRYYVTWCNYHHSPTIGVGYTHDFETFYQLDNAFLPFNRNGVLFPAKSTAKSPCSAGPATTAILHLATSSTAKART